MMGKKRSKIEKKAGTNPLSLAGEVARRVQIENIRLLDTSASCRLLNSDLPEHLQVSCNVQTKVEGLSIFVELRFVLAFSYAEEDDPAIRIAATFEAIYRIASVDGLTEEHFGKFGELNGMYNVWPYLREYVQGLTSRMGLPPLTIPVFRPGQEAKFSRKSVASPDS